MASQTRIRLGTASPSTQATTALTLSLLASLASRAAALGVDILTLPEALIGGYPRGEAFGCVVGGRSEAGRDEFARYFDAAADLGDTVGHGAGAGDEWVARRIGGGDAVRGDGTREQIEGIARDSGVFLVVGCVEKAGGSLYCSVVYVCPKEGMIGKRRKVMPTGSERLIWAQGCPSTLRAVSTVVRGVRVNLAAAICWENYMPLLRQALYAQNVNLYLAPTADARDAWMGLVRTIGVEGRCFVVSSNMCVRGGGHDSPAEAVESGDGGDGGVLVDGAPADGEGGGDAAVHDDMPPRQARRRSSAITKDGFEIALPHGHSPTQISRRSRRKSVFDDDGNQIVLCCPEDEDHDHDHDSHSPTAPSSSTTQQQPKPDLSNGHTTAKTTTTKTTKTTTFLSRGGSSIVSPFGDVLAGPQWEDGEGIITADVDFRDCIRGRLDMDTAGSYSRNDAFRFTVQGLDMDPLPY